MTCIKIFLADLLGTQYLFEIYHTSPATKSSENVVKSGYLETPLCQRAPIVFRNEGGI